MYVQEKLFTVLFSLFPNSAYSYQMMNKRLLEFKAELRQDQKQRGRDTRICAKTTGRSHKVVQKPDYHSFSDGIYAEFLLKFCVNSESQVGLNKYL